MTNDRAKVKEVLAAERRTLQLLDGQIVELEALLSEEDAPDAQNAAKVHPYFYGVMGSDGQPGIILNDGDAQGPRTGIGNPIVFEGVAQIQEDAPFVWTHILLTQNVLNSQPLFASVQGMSSLQLASLLEVGFIDNGSGRVLFQADRNNAVGEFLSTPFFDTLREYEADEPDRVAGSTLCRPGAYAQGHGPNAAFELPAEVVLPASGAVTVQVKPALFDLDNDLTAVRVYVALLGYKIFGD